MDVGYLTIVLFIVLYIFAVIGKKTLPTKIAKISLTFKVNNALLKNTRTKKGYEKWVKMMVNRRNGILLTSYFLS